MTPRLQVIVASTRPGRVGLPVAEWFHGIARAHIGFETELVDLAAFNLPVYDEPKHPVMQQYAHEHTRRWAASVAGADAYVFVMPEYNFNPPPSLVNALNYVYKEWNYKPAAFVSYGGVSGGLRAVQSAKLLLTTLKIVPINEAVTIQMVGQHVKDGAFTPNEHHVQSAEGLLPELLRWTNALKAMRT